MVTLHLRLLRSSYLLFHVIPEPRGEELDKDILSRAECSEDWGFLEVRDTFASISSTGEWGDEQLLGSVRQEVAGEKRACCNTGRECA